MRVDAGRRREKDTCVFLLLMFYNENTWPRRVSVENMAGPACDLDLR